MGYKELEQEARSEYQRLRPWSKKIIYHWPTRSYRTLQVVDVGRMAQVHSNEQWIAEEERRTGTPWQEAADMIESLLRREQRPMKASEICQTLEITEIITNKALRLDGRFECVGSSSSPNGGRKGREWALVLE